MRLTKRILAMIMSILMIVTSANIVVLAADEPTITVSSTTGKNGDTVDVTVSMSGNPGVVSVTLDLEYDSSALTLTGVTDTGLIPGQMHTTKYTSPYRLTWANDTAPENFTVNGQLATLHFQVNEGAAAGDYPIEVTIPKDGIYNYDVDNIDFALVDGKITVTAEEEPDPEPDPDPVDGDVVIEVSEVTVLAGDEAVVEFNVIKNDTGFAGVTLILKHDSALGIPTITYGDFDSPKTNPEISKYAFINMDGENYIGTGNLMTFTFPANPELAEGKYSVSATIVEAIDENLDDISAVVDGGYVEIVHGVPGDINMDGEVSLKDILLLIKYYLEEDVVVDERAVDTNGDGEVSLKDILLLIKYYLEEDVAVYYAGKAYYRQNVAEVSLLNTAYTLNAVQGDIPAVTSETGALKLNIEEVTVKAGSDITVNVEIEENPGLAGITLDITYNKDYITYTGGKKPATLEGFTRQVKENDGSLAVVLYESDAMNITDIGTLISLPFTVSETASEGSHEDYVQISVRETSNEDLEDVPYTINKCVITITGCEHPADKVTHTPATPATCMVEGNVEYWTCFDCEKKLDKDGNVLSDEDVVIPTSEGKHVGTLEDAERKFDVNNHWQLCQCGEIDPNTVEAHKGGEADCMNKAVCEVCEAAYGEVDDTNHVGGTELRDVVAPTCSKDGYTGDTWCLGCETKIADGAIDPATGKHVDADGDWETDGEYHWHTCGVDCEAVFDKAEHTGGEATCKEQAICETCNVAYGEVDDTNHVGETEVRDAVTETCGDAGYTGDTYCLDCGEMIEAGDVIPATGKHAWSSWKIGEKEATRECTVCDATETKPAEMKQISAEDSSTENNTANIDVFVVGDAEDEKEVVITNEALQSAINELNANAGEDAESGATLKVNVSDQDANTGNIEMGAIDTLVDLAGDDSHRVDNIEFDMTDGSITFNVDALETIQAKAADADSVIFNIQTVVGDVVDALTGENGVFADSEDAQEKLNEFEEECDELLAAIDVSILANGQEIHDDFNADVIVSINVGAGLEGTFNVKHIEDGKEEDYKNEYDSDTGIIDVYAPHFSVIVVGYNEPEKEEETKDNDTISAIEAAMIALRNQRFTITAAAGKGGSISNEGRNNVKFDRSITFEINPDEGYAIESVLVNGKDVGAVEEYTFKRVRKNQTIVASFVEIEDESSDVIDEAIDEESWANPFVDVDDDADYIDAIEFVYENGLFKGISDTEFAPEMTMTRGMFVTVLGRADGVDTMYYTGTSFDDVVIGEWYAPYVEWAAEAGIVLGYGDGKFGVNDQITVEQAVVILARYAEYAGIYEAADISLELFADADSVSDWALEAMMWAVENGIYTGEYGVLAPQALAPRALIAEMLYNLAKVFAD